MLFLFCTIKKQLFHEQQFSLQNAFIPLFLHFFYVLLAFLDATGSHINTLMAGHNQVIVKSTHKLGTIWEDASL